MGKKNKPIAVGYTRISRDNDTSIPNQKNEIKHYADENGYNLTKIYDEGELSSGFNNQREKYQEMILDIEDKDIDAIIVRDMSRISRDKTERIKFLFDMEEMDVEIISTQKGVIDIGEDEEWIIEILSSYMDDRAKRKEIQRSKREIEKRKEKGYYQGRPPYGYRFDDEGKYLTEHPQQYKKAMKAIEMRENNHTYQEIQDETGISLGTIYRILDRKDMYTEQNNQQTQ